MDRGSGIDSKLKIITYKADPRVFSIRGFFYIYQKSEQDFFNWNILVNQGHLKSGCMPKTDFGRPFWKEKNRLKP